MTQSTPQLMCVDPGEVDRVWPHVVALLKAAITHTNLDRFSEIERDVLSGRSLLWLAWSDHLEAAATLPKVPRFVRPAIVGTATVALTS